MNKSQSEALSARIREAINPPRRQTATARILDEVEPLPVLKPVLPEGQHASDNRGPSAFQANVSGTTPVIQAAPVQQTTGVNQVPERMSVGLQSPLVTQTPAVTVTPVRGVTGIPNAILDSLLPQLEPFEQLVYLRLYRLSHGFRSETCLIGLDRLATVCKISPSSAIRAIRELENKRLIRRLHPKLGGSMSESRGNHFWVFRPPVPQTAPVSQPPGVSQTPPVSETPIKEITDDSINKTHHQINPAPQLAGVPETPPVRGTTGGVRERENADNDSLRYLAQTINLYTQVTKNPWLETDTAAYIENGVGQVPFDKVKSVMLAVSERAGSRINSFAYFVKEILATSDQRTMTGRRKAFATIIKRVRENHVGLANYGVADFVFDVKAACIREGVIFDNDLFNDIASGQQ